MTLDGRLALITGGSRGIGRTIAVDLARRGADVAFTYLRNEDAAKETVALVEAEGRRAVAVRSRIDTAERCAALVDEAAAALGLAPGAGDEEIRAAFARKMSAFRWHPAGSTAQICIAYETLRDPARRRDYDLTLGIIPKSAPRQWGFAVTPQRWAPFIAAPMAGVVEAAAPAAEPHVEPEPEAESEVRPEVGPVAGAVAGAEEGNAGNADAGAGPGPVPPAGRPVNGRSAGGLAHPAPGPSATRAAGPPWCSPAG